MGLHHWGADPHGDDHSVGIGAAAPHEDLEAVPEEEKAGDESDPIGEGVLRLVLRRNAAAIVIIIVTTAATRGSTSHLVHKAKRKGHLGHRGRLLLSSRGRG